MQHRPEGDERSQNTPPYMPQSVTLRHQVIKAYGYPSSDARELTVEDVESMSDAPPSAVASRTASVMESKDYNAYKLQAPRASLVASTINESGTRSQRSPQDTDIESSYPYTTRRGVPSSRNGPVFTYEPREEDEPEERDHAIWILVSGRQACLESPS